MKRYLARFPKGINYIIFFLKNMWTNSRILELIFMKLST